MLLPILVPAFVLMAGAVVGQISPFYWQDGQLQYSSTFKKKGRVEQLGRSGVSAMHAVLINHRKILIIDKAEWNEATFDSGQNAFSVEYDIINNDYRMLHLESNTFCSAGGFLKNGTFISTGGGERQGGKWKAVAGWQSIRYFTPCNDGTCEWEEYVTSKTSLNRWYPTVEQLPEGDLMIMGGSTRGVAVNDELHNVPSIEYWPPRPEGLVDFLFLNETMPYNLYPVVHTLPDGNLFVFAKHQSIIFNYKTNKVVRRLPDIPGNVRSYPLTAASVMLPLDPKNEYNVEILICGGSTAMRNTAKADNTCGRINLGDKDPKWEMDTFVYPRLMPDGVILADGTVMFLNGCQRGFAGYNNRNHDPTFDLLIYDPAQPKGKRWKQDLANTNIARMYHSVALSLPDGRVWVAGSNNNSPPNLTAPYPTEFRVEYFSPPYLFQSSTRPLVSNVPKVMVYGGMYTIKINLNYPHELQRPGLPTIKVALLRPGFSTHSMHMSQRYVVLIHELQDGGNTLTINSPPHAAIFPPGPAILHVLRDGVPAEGTYLHIAENEDDVRV
ncbi:glyoxal oxidase N-terminus-domain-containing protein [Umbelopsis sp. PMI_123]|nr:glyoxal oxidase N-terminus-domain-containing protein [Umbelopsis sp. PMI_123]